MFSRAHLLIEKEINNLKESPPWGVEIEPIDDENIFELVAQIHGLRETIWEGGIFQIYIKFDEHFNVRPPELFFLTIPFHPNVDMKSGRPCLDYLDDLDLWRPDFSLSMMLVTLQVLLSNPNLRDAVNVEAVEMMNKSPHAYRQLVLECVTASQRVAAESSMPLETSETSFGKASEQNIRRTSLPPAVTSSRLTRNSVDIGHHIWKSSTILKAVESPLQFKQLPEEEPSLQTDQPVKKVKHTIPTPVPRRAKVSFDDYHTTWKLIATSKPDGLVQNQLLAMMPGYSTISKIHSMMPHEELEEQIKLNVEEHKNITMGRFGNKGRRTEDRDAKLAKLQQMKKIYLAPRYTPIPGLSSEAFVDSGTPGVESKQWEKEADELVSWTKNLDDATIDI